MSGGRVAVAMLRIGWFGVLTVAASAVRGAVVGVEGFGYPDGAVANQAGGTGWAYERTDEAGAPAAAPSDWDNVTGVPAVGGGQLTTLATAVKREYCGPSEGSAFPSNEREGAFRGTGTFFFKVLMNRAAGADWSGVSSYDFGAERIFFGVPGGQGASKYFGINDSGSSLSSHIQQDGRTYTLVGQVDFDADVLRLWVDPSRHHRALDRHRRAYTDGSWATALRLASGGTAATTWDDLLVATTWDDLGLPEQTDDLYGRDGFTYADGSVANQAGGTGWRWNNWALVNAAGQSDWEVVFGSATVERGLLRTSNGGATREYNGPGEGGGDDTTPTDERLGAVRGRGRVYYSVLFNRDGNPDWAGMSSYDFGTEKVFFGVPGGQVGQKYFGVMQSGVGTTFSAVPVVDNRTYRLVTLLDYENDTLRLWVNPVAGSEGTPDVQRAYTDNPWSSELRLASGGGGSVEWDDLRVAAVWNDLGLPVGTSASDLLAYEPFDGYAAGSLPGQEHRGRNFLAGGSWWGDEADESSVTASGGLSYGRLFRKGGKLTTKGNGGVGTRGELDLLPGGVFNDAGYVDPVSGDLGGGNVAKTLYFSFLARSTTAAGADNYAAAELYRDDAEVLGVGDEYTPSRYSVFGAPGAVALNSANHEVGQTWESIDTDVHLFVVRIDFTAGGNDACTVWLDPGIGFGETGQNPACKTILPAANYAFDRLHFRGGNTAYAWDFDEIRFARTWADAVPNDLEGTLFMIR